MSSLKSHEGFNNVSFISKIIASAAVDAFLKGEALLPLSKFREENIPEEEIQKALVELHENSIIGLEGKVNDYSIDSRKIAAITFNRLSLGVNFAGNNQPSLMSDPKEKTVEYGEGVQDHRVGFAAGFEQGLFFGLAHLYPQPRATCVVAQHHVGFVRVRQAGAKAQHAVSVAHVLQLVGLQRQRHQPDHHAFVGLARVARQGERVVGVVAVVNVGDLNVRLEDGGFDGHGVCVAQTRRASSAALPT